MARNSNKSAQSSESEQKDSDESKEKLALLSLQKQMQLLRVRELIFLSSFIFIAGISRVFMQPFPSVEPITFFAILGGWLFGSKKGFTVGASSLFLSNFFVMGGQGPWTFFQLIGFGTAGFLGGFLRKRAGVAECLVIALVSTLIFEIIMNISSLFFLPMNFFGAFLMGVPFLIVHLVSNAIFSFMLPKVKAYVEKKGHFDERDIYMQFFDKIHRRKNEK